MRPMRVLLASFGLFLSACGGATAPNVDQVATLNVVISDSPETKFAAGPMPSPAVFIHHKSFGKNYFHGRLSGTHGVEISKNGRDWIALGTPAAVDLPLQVEGEVRELHAVREVPDGTYAYLRLTSRAASAALETGAEIGDLALDAPTSLDLGEAGTLVVEARLANPIFLAPGSEVTLAIDLNTEAWLSPENVEAGRIPATDVEAAISVTPHVLLPALILPAAERSI